MRAAATTPSPWHDIRTDPALLLGRSQADDPIAQTSPSRFAASPTKVAASAAFRADDADSKGEPEITSRTYRVSVQTLSGVVRARSGKASGGYEYCSPPPHPAVPHCGIDSFDEGTASAASCRVCDACRVLCVARGRDRISEHSVRHRTARCDAVDVDPARRMDTAGRSARDVGHCGHAHAGRSPAIRVARRLYGPIRFSSDCGASCRTCRCTDRFHPCNSDVGAV